MRALLVSLVMLTLAALIVTRAEPLAPRVAVAPLTVVGRTTPITVTATDRGSGLQRVEVRLVPDGQDGVVLASQEFPRRSWFGSGVREATVAPTLEQAGVRVPEGPAALEVWATDHSVLAALRGGPQLTARVDVDLTPPSVEVLTNQHRVRQGGSEFVVYRVGADAVESGVRVGDVSYPGFGGLFAETALRGALFAVPATAAADVRPQVTATDGAGNTRAVSFDVAIQPRRLPERTLPLSDEFLARKVPELLHAEGMPDEGDLVAGYLRVNRDIRARSEERVDRATANPTPIQLWGGPFVRLPNAAPLAGFADRRSYQYRGKIIDHAMHMGYDLASLRMSPVPAGNTGKVVFAGPLGIYGNTVILDHGLGLFSLYGHLSEVAVRDGERVERGQSVGKTGDTGLAAGDHLHFGMMVHGTYVDPVEWWDGHWIHDHVDLRLNAYPRAGATGTTS